MGLLILGLFVGFLIGRKVYRVKKQPGFVMPPPYYRQGQRNPLPQTTPMHPYAPGQGYQPIASFNPPLNPPQGR